MAAIVCSASAVSRVRFNKSNASSSRPAPASRLKVSAGAEFCASSRLASLTAAPWRRYQTRVESYEGKSSQGSAWDDWPSAVVASRQTKRSRIIVLLFTIYDLPFYQCFYSRFTCSPVTRHPSLLSIYSRFTSICFESGGQKLLPDYLTDLTKLDGDCNSLLA